MFTEIKQDSLHSVGEVGLIEIIRELLAEINPPHPYGIGDDCAIIEASPYSSLLTSDSLSVGQHFDPSLAPEAAGRKLVNRNLSDIAAMGGFPEQGLLTLLCPQNLQIDWLRNFLQGVTEASRKHGLKIVGGDVSGIAESNFSSVLQLRGRLEHPPLLRTGACIGDALYVTGELGGSILGKHFEFEPRLAEGQWLARTGMCTALMDLTDGLAKDLRALLPEGAAAALDLEALPISAAADECAAADARSALEHAFCDGEDYELLFTIDADLATEDFEKNWRTQFPATKLSKIGILQKMEHNIPYVDRASGEAIKWQTGFEHLK